MSSDSDNSNVVVITRAQLRNQARKRRTGPGRRRRWYDRAGVKKLGNDQAPDRTIQYVIRDGDLIRNNGDVVLEREGQIAIVIAVDHNMKTADVVGPDGPGTWEFREISRTIEGQRNS